MSEYLPVTSITEFQNLNDEEVVAGYINGLDKSAEPGNDKSRSFWHGWRNAMIDRGILPTDRASENVAREFIRKQKAH